MRRKETSTFARLTQVNLNFSLSGSYILEGFLVPYPMVSERFIEFNVHLTITGPLLKKALDMAVKLVVVA